MSLKFIHNLENLHSKRTMTSSRLLSHNFARWSRLFKLLWEVGGGKFFFTFTLAQDVQSCPRNSRLRPTTSAGLPTLPLLRPHTIMQGLCKCVSLSCNCLEPPCNDDFHLNLNQLILSRTNCSFYCVTLSSQQRHAPWQHHAPSQRHWSIRKGSFQYVHAPSDVHLRTYNLRYVAM